MKKNIHATTAFLRKITALLLAAVMLMAAAAAAAEDAVTSANAEETVNALLSEQKEKNKDAWQIAIYESGAKDITAEEDKLTFALRSYNPQLKELGAYAKAEDPAAWLKTALENASRYDLVISLPLDGSGQVPLKSVNTLKAAVQKAAAAAKTAFSSKDMQTALKAELFPIPYSGKLKDVDQLKKPSDSFNAWYKRHKETFGSLAKKTVACVYALQKSQTLNVQKGPHALAFSCIGGKLEDVIGNAIKKVVSIQKTRDKEERPLDDPGPTLANNLLSVVIDAAPKVKTKTDIRVDIDDLAGGTLPAEYVAYVASLDWEKNVDKLRDKLLALPDEAVVPLPKNGILTGGNKGTKVIVNAGDQTNPTYIVLRNADTGKIVATAMLHAKKKVTLRAPKGNYEMAWCSGPSWHGTEKLFGDDGIYNKSEIFEVPSSNYYLTLTLRYSKSGKGVGIYGADPSDFQ